MKIDKNIEIEDLVRILPKSVTFLMDNGIRCLRCGEPIWGTLEDAANEKGFDSKKIDEFVVQLNKMAEKMN